MQLYIIISAIIALMFKLIMLAFMLTFLAIFLHVLYQAFIKNDSTMLDKIIKGGN